MRFLCLLFLTVGARLSQAQWFGVGVQTAWQPFDTTSGKVIRINFNATSFESIASIKEEVHIRVQINLYKGPEEYPAGFVFIGHKIKKGRIFKTVIELNSFSNEAVCKDYNETGSISGTDQFADDIVVDFLSDSVVTAGYGTYASDTTHSSCRDTFSAWRDLVSGGSIKYINLQFSDISLSAITKLGLKCYYQVDTIRHTAGELKLTHASMSPAKRLANGKISSPSKLVDGTLSTYAQLGHRGWMKVYLEHRATIARVELYSPGQSTSRNTINGARVYIVSSRGQENALCGRVTEPTPFMFSGEAKEMYTSFCDGQEGSSIQVVSESRFMKVATIKVYGAKTSKDDSVEELEEEYFFPTEGPEPTVEPPYTEEEIEEILTPDIKINKETGIKEWEPKLKKPIPYKVLEEAGKASNAIETPLGFLAFAGYVDYSLDVNSKDSSPRNKQTTQKRTEFTSTDLELAAKSFMRFNGFVEDGSITDEMMNYMKKDRCGNHDIVYGEGNEKCNELKETDIARERKYTDQDIMTKVSVFVLPGERKNNGLFPEVMSYYFEADVKFLDVRNGKSRTIFVGINYDKIEANGKDMPLEVVALRFFRSKLCAQFVTLAEGQLLSNLASRETILESCYTPTSDEEKTKAFKIRLDVYKPLAGILGKVYVTITGKDVAQNVYKTSLLSSVVVMKRDDHTMTRARLCQHRTGSNNLARAARRKRFTVSHHKWENPDNVLRFNFQNYSSHLGQDGTRQEVLKAINLYTEQSGLSFSEVTPTSFSEIVFMFIKGRHADGLNFAGAGSVKAHAYSPVHSEIHFNDHEQFETSSSNAEKPTSMFYVAAHEIGHALGILHSEKRDALMTAGYPGGDAFSFADLHYDDINAISILYPGIVGAGTLEKLNNVELGTRYTAKSPYPTECHKQIDAALSIDDIYFIVSDAFVWQMRQKDQSDISAGFEPVDGFPKRVTDVFQQAHGSVEAIFKIMIGGGRFVVFVLHSGTLISSYTFKRAGSMIRFYVHNAQVERSSFLAGNGIIVDKSIKAAFSYGSKTILVTNELESYYEITWNKRSKTPNSVTLKTSMTSLIGKDLRRSDFNAAMTLDGKTQNNLIMFAVRYVFVEQTFATNGGDKSIYFEVPDHFEVGGWCPARNW